MVAAPLLLHAAPRAASAWLYKPACQSLHNTDASLVCAGLSGLVRDLLPSQLRLCVQRLKTRTQFQAVLAGSVVAKTEHFALHRNGLDAKALQPAPGKSTGQNTPVASLFPVQATWIGAMVPKRWARRAVTRNAIKRQIYTVSAGFLDQYPKAAFLVRLRREFSRKDFPSATSDQLKEVVRTEMQALMQAGAVSK